MIEDVKNWLRERAGKVVIIGTGALLALSVITIVMSLVSDDSAETDAQAEKLIADLDEDLESARADLAAKHDKLLSELSGMDAERVGRDQKTGRSLLLNLTDSSASSRDVKQTQQLLRSRYEFLDDESRSLSEFIPEWMSATRSDKDTGTAYMIGELDVNLCNVQGLDYAYVGLARMDPVAKDAQATHAVKSEFVVFTFSTSPDDTVTALDAYRVSSRTRDALLADDETENGEPATTAPGKGG